MLNQWPWLHAGFPLQATRRCCLGTNAKVYKWMRTKKIQEKERWTLTYLIESFTSHSFVLLVTARITICTACEFRKGPIIPECCIQNKYVTSSRLPISKSQWKREGLKEKGKREKGRKLFGLCPLRTGLTGAKLRLSAPESLSFTQADKYAHTLTAGVTSYIRQQEQRAKYTLSQNHAFINTFTHSELFHIAEWYGSERSDSLKCCIKGTAITNTEGLQWASLCQHIIEYTYLLKKYFQISVWDLKHLILNYFAVNSPSCLTWNCLQMICFLYWLWKFAQGLPNSWYPPL